ncbi:MAG: polyphosphate kinase 2 family protein [bacterium]
MLETVDLSLSLAKPKYDERQPKLKERLFELEHAIFSAKIPVAIVFEGWAAAGKGTTIRVLAERLDPRAFRVVPIAPPRTFETHYPWLWRFWLRIPARGQIVVFDTSWYRRVLSDRVLGAVRKREWRDAYQDIADFEEQLAADGTVILKFWMHISKKEQASRIKKLMKSERTAWQVTKEDVAQHKSYEKHLAAVEEMLARTDSPSAPWVVVEATDRHHARVKVMEAIIAALETRLRPSAPAANGKAVKAAKAVKAGKRAKAKAAPRAAKRAKREAR